MRPNNAATLLRWGIAFVLFYGAIIGLLWPAMSLIPGKPLLVAFSLYELALSGWLFWGRKVVWSSLFGAITFAVIVLVDFQSMSVVFPFIGLGLASLALFDMTMAKQHIKNHHDTIE